MGVFGDIADFLTSPFLAAAGWAWDTVVTGLTDWVMKGALALLMMLWGFMDAASRPQLDAEWFARADGAPLQVAAAIGVVMVSLLVVAAVIQAVHLHQDLLRASIATAEGVSRGACERGAIVEGCIHGAQG